MSENEFRPVPGVVEPVGRRTAEDVEKERKQAAEGSSPETNPDLDLLAEELKALQKQKVVA